VKSPTDLETIAARDLLWSDADERTSEYAEAIATLSRAVECGALEHAGTIAEVLAFSKETLNKSSPALS
jgi:hypothetical protein